ncbi:E3 ubiquitin-protein ligase TRIM71-like [Oculina patagonica]
MDIKTLLNNLHEEVSCPVCMTAFIEPKLLPCLHSFCLHCLKGIQRTSGRNDIITCPECRRESRVPGGNLDELPTNFRINSLLDVLAIKVCNTTAVRCGNCDKKSAQSFYCFQCCSFWCESDCISLHNGIKANKGHNVLALKDFQDEDFEKVLKRPAFCRKPGHEKKELEFFCKVCEVSICNACALTDHEGHAKMLLEEAANERKLQVKSAVASRREKVQMKKNEITKLDENCVKIQEHAAKVKRSAQQFAENMHQVIDAKKQEIINEVENQARESLQRLGMKKSAIENEVKMSEVALGKAEALLERSPSAEIMQPNKFLNRILQEEVEQDEPADRDNGIYLEFDFVENQKLLDDVSAEKFGFIKRFPETRPHLSSAEGKGISEATVGLEAQFILSTRNAEGEQCFDERDSVTVQIRNQQGHDCATKAQVQDNRDGTYKISYFAKETGKCEASVKVNEEHVRGSPFNIQVKPRQYRPVLSFGQQGLAAGMLKNPWGVAVNERNEIAVTDNGNNRVQIFSSDETCLSSFGRKGNEQGEFDFPVGIAFDNNGNIIVVDSRNHRVQFFSGLGEYLSQFGEEGNLDHQLMYSHGLSVNCDGNIIVADTGNKLVKIFSPSGQLLQKIGGDGYFTFPVHCVQYENYLIISDSNEHCVNVFDGEGNFMHKFGKKGDGDGEFNAPDCLSVNKAGHLMVCDTNNHRIQLFELSGKFITKFGTKGSGIGEFNKPVSTAVLSDGRIVVTDFLNHRIQIFE